MTTIVGPLPQITYWDGTRQPYIPPANTTDIRYHACRDHHPACDCREAEHAELAQEHRAETTRTASLEDAVAAVARLHRRRDNRYVGTVCQECHQAWPCPTWRLVRPVSALACFWEGENAGPATPGRDE